MTKFLPLASLVFVLSGCNLVSEIPQNFEDCVATGAPIMESSPRQCGWSGQTFVEEISTPVEAPVETPVQIANPASVNCDTKGGTLEIRENEDGGQVGFCIFSDGSECEEWAFFRDECQPENNETAQSETPICEDTCGNDTCEEVVCQAEGCPCSETPTTCPADCPVTN